MNIHFRKIARGPAWERWLVMEDQHGDTAFAGEVILTYADTSSCSEVECDVLFARELDDEEADQVLDAVLQILSGQGNVTLFSTRQVICKGFSLLQEECNFEGDEEEP